MSAADQQAPATHALATLVQLARRARDAGDGCELDFIAVNETHALTPYRQAALWLDERVAALSGVVSPEANAPYVHWLTRVIGSLRQQAGSGEARALSPDDLSAADATEWKDWLPAHAFWLPIPGVGDDFPGGALLLARDHPWIEAERTLLTEWAATWAHARAFRHRRSTLRRWWRRWSDGPRDAPSTDSTGSIGSSLTRWLRTRRAALVLATVVVLLLPVHLTVLGPAELVPLDPAVIRAPLDGVVDRVLVTPNQKVQANDALFEFDRASIENRLEVSLRTLDMVQAEYRQKAQQALFDAASKTQLAVLQGRIAEKSAEVDYLRTLSERGVVLSPRAGVVLFDDPTEWVGRPTVTGERVMVVADERAVEIEAWLSPADAISLADGSTVTFYRNADPLQPLRASLRYLGHEAIERPDGNYAYRVRATLAKTTIDARVGLKGTAKLEGSKVSVAYWILRRPLAVARSWLGV
jgi:hypothetical protein